jgi:hypothetical protein
MGADLATASVIAAFIAPLLLICVYTVTAPWFRTQVGRTLVTTNAAISLALLPPFVHRVSGGPAAVSAAFTVFQAATWGFLALVLARMSWVIIATQQRGRREARDTLSAGQERRTT